MNTTTRCDTPVSRLIKLLVMAVVVLTTAGCATQHELRPAIESGNYVEVQQALDRGANPNADVYGSRPLFDVIYTDEFDPRMFDILVAGGADPSLDINTFAPDRPALFWAQTSEAVRAIVGKGVSPDQRNGQGQTLLHFTNNPEVIGALLELGANPELTDPNGRTPKEEKQYQIDKFLAMTQWRVSNGAGGYHTFSPEQHNNVIIDMEVGLAVLEGRETDREKIAALYPLEENPVYIATEKRNSELNAAADRAVIADNSGRYLSPYTSDGVTAEWVNKAINSQMGATAGSGVGAAAGAYVAGKALENVPLIGSILGGVVGAEVGKAVGREAAFEASGGEQYMRETSDMSFDSLPDMARYLRQNYGSDPNYSDVITATTAVYPEFGEAMAAY